MRVSSKGQVTIPRDLREIAGIEPNSEVLFGIEDGKVTIMPKDGRRAEADEMRLRRFLSVLDRLEGTGDPTLDADAVMAMTRDR
jgi:AbrB family looped-hinge helix DNA binding protein